VSREKVEKLIEEKGMKDRIIMMGSQGEIQDKIYESSVYVLCSNVEGMPNALIEAMALGMPVVATDCPCGGPRTLICHEQNGLLIPVGDEKAMADAVNRLIEDRELAEKLGAKARKISERVDGAAVLAQWKEYIEKVINAYQKQ